MWVRMQVCELDSLDSLCCIMRPRSGCNNSIFIASRVERPIAQTETPHACSRECIVDVMIRASDSGVVSIWGHQL